MNRSEKRNPERKDICYIAADVVIPSPTGSSVHTIELASNFAARGLEVHVVCRRAGRRESPAEVISGFKVHRLYRFIIAPGRRRDPSAGSGFKKSAGIVNRIYYWYLLTIFRIYVGIKSALLISRFDIDLIIERETSFGAGGLASLLTGRPLILEIIGPRYSRFSAMRSKKILYYTESMLRSWVDRTKTIPVSAGVNLNLFKKDSNGRAAMRERLGVGPEGVLVGYIGTFQIWHGVDTIITCSKLLKDDFPNLKFLFVGPGSDSFKSLAEKLNVAHLCIFTGPVNYDDVPLYINACDVLLAPYNPSADTMRQKFGVGFPLKVLEYMACGIPVVSTRIQPVDLIIKDKETGILIEPGDAEQLAGAIKYLIQNPVKAERFSENARALVQNNYSWDKIANLFLS